MTWQPIETAPKDGSDFLMGGDGQPTHEGRWFEPSKCADIIRKQGVYEAGWYWAGYSGPVGPIFPTHWMPLPSPPEPKP